MSALESQFVGDRVWHRLNKQGDAWLDLKMLAQALSHERLEEVVTR